MKSERTKWRGIRWGLITQIVVVESEYILSHPQGPKFRSIHKQPLCCRQRATIFNDDSKQVAPPFFLLVWRVPDPVHSYCSSWRLIDLATALETTISDWVRSLLHIQDLFLFFCFEIRSRPHSASCGDLLSVQHRALWAGTIRNKMFVLLPSPGSFSESHLSPIKAAPAKLFSAVKAHESYYAPHQIQFCPLKSNRPSHHLSQSMLSLLNG